MLYFSLHASHKPGRRHCCTPCRPQLNKRAVIVVSNVFWILCFPILVPIQIKESIEKTKNHWRFRVSPQWKEWEVKLRERKAKEKSFKKQRSKGKPHPRPKPRKPALTFFKRSGDCLSNSSLSNLTAKIDAQKENTEQGSPTLLGLPSKVRQQIWGYVLGGHTIAVYCGKGRLVHAFEEAADADGERYGAGQPSFNVESARTHLSALLKICRQIYSEGVNILYTQNTFSLYQNNTLFDFQSTLLPHRFSLIQSLILHWQFRDDETFARNISGSLETRVAAPWDVETWRKACKLLSDDMPGLQTLFVVIRGPFIMNDGIIDMLQSLRDVKVEKDFFRVRVPWPRVIALSKEESIDRCFENHGFPFRVIRTGKVIPDIDPGPEIYEF